MVEIGEVACRSRVAPDLEGQGKEKGGGKRGEGYLACNLSTIVNRGIG
jgi:hypothetical protein